jgi:FixJ family two-component response regulator/anti-sigma regulatory factor (Ser/Thr protein kinase)
MPGSVLFVDDEEDIRFSFEVHFEGQFPIHLASNGAAALEVLKNEPSIGVAVTDIRMPEMNGLELIRQAREQFSDVGFIVVSGHGEAEQIIEALRLGARNFLRKPYNLLELEEAIKHETRRYEILKEERKRQDREKHAEHYITGVEGLTYSLPNDVELVVPIAFRLAQTAHTLGVCDDGERGNLALALIEIITNAMEHGNLGLTGAEKVALKSRSEQDYQDELSRRKADETYGKRMVQIKATINSEEAVIYVQDEGDGFDHKFLPDPTDPNNLFLPSGRGILLARTFLDEVAYLDKGNAVRLVKRKPAH